MRKKSQHSEKTKQRIKAKMAQYRCRQRAIKRIHDFEQLDEKAKKEFIKLTNKVDVKLEK